MVGPGFSPTATPGSVQGRNPRRRSRADQFALIITSPGTVASSRRSLQASGRGLKTKRKPENRTSKVRRNILWFCFGGLWTALGHLAAALLLAITVIGIPFAIAHLKLARVAAWPFGYTIVPASMAGTSRVVVSVAPIGPRS